MGEPRVSTSDDPVTATAEIIQRLYRARGLEDMAEFSMGLADLLPPDTLLGVESAAQALAAAITRGERIVIVGDYDADGATACAVAVRGLRRLGAQDVLYLIPDRAKEGYGLTPAIVARAAALHPQWLITVDNGINSQEGAACAAALGIRLIITDHHLAGEMLPEAVAIVDPNQPGDRFGSKALAGVGVMLYVLLALRRALHATQVSLADLLDLVALGTVADCVVLDRNNRLLVRAGLKRINAGKATVGIAALLQVSGRTGKEVFAQDLGFQIGPRLNAAGRLADMAVGVRLLLTDDPTEAVALAQELDRLNRDRRARQAQMQSDADMQLATLADRADLPSGLCLMDTRWHPGIVGILAGRLKDRYKRPTIALAPAEDGLLRGSGRSVFGLNLYDVLVALAERAPHLMIRFGGHAAAAGLTMDPVYLTEFAESFDALVVQRMGKGPYGGAGSDGVLQGHEINLVLAQAIRAGGPWGSGFPEPLFVGRFWVATVQSMTGGHVRLEVALDSTGERIKAVAFRCVHVPAVGTWVELQYRLGMDDYSGRERVCLYVEELKTAVPM